MSDSFRDILPSEKGVTLYVGVGNPDRGDDNAGSFTVGMLQESDRVRVCKAFDRPELGYDMALELKPVKVVFIDAADMGLPSGTVQDLPEDIISERTMTTHKMPVPLITRLIREEIAAETVIFGIQPESTEIMGEMSKSVKDSCVMIAGLINRNR